MEGARRIKGGSGNNGKSVWEAEEADKRIMVKNRSKESDGRLARGRDHG